jgi:hypothetical protein
MPFQPIGLCWRISQVPNEAIDPGMSHSLSSLASFQRRSTAIPRCKFWHGTAHHGTTQHNAGRNQSTVPMQLGCRNSSNSWQSRQPTSFVPFGVHRSSRVSRRSSPQRNATSPSAKNIKQRGNPEIDSSRRRSRWIDPLDWVQRSSFSSVNLDRIITLVVVPKLLSS